jgi:hypothetical protein
MSGAIPPLPQYAFMAWCSVEAQGQLYLLLYCPQVFKIVINNIYYIKIGYKVNEIYILCHVPILCIQPFSGNFDKKLMSFKKQLQQLKLIVPNKFLCELSILDLTEIWRMIQEMKNLDGQRYNITIMHTMHKNVSYVGPPVECAQ